MRKNDQFPAGIAYLRLLTKANESERDISEAHWPKIEKEREMLAVIGTMLSALFQAATCHRKCHGGDHVLEALAGRAHNLACAAVTLMEVGYYDEALNLIRGIGEIGNLVQLFLIDPSVPTRWIDSNKKTRLRDFSPVAVRKALENSTEANTVLGEGWFPKLCLDHDWYSSLCERYAHVTPKTIPNAHNLADHGVVGGQFQQQGVKECTNRLFEALLALTIPICSFFNFRDILKELENHTKELREIGS